MTGRERIDAVLAGRTPDFAPRVPILMRYAAEYIGSDYGRFAADHAVLVEANRRCAADFGFDQVSAISDPYRETAGFGGEIAFVADGVPRLVRPPLADDRDFDRLPTPDPFAAPRMKDRVDGVAGLRAACPDHSVLGWVEGPIAEAADLRGVDAFLMDLVDDPDYAAALMDRVVETAVAFARAQIDAGADMVGVGDALASQIGPGLYGEWVLPREKRLVDAIHAAGARVRMHICGDIGPILPGLATLGLDVLDVDHMVGMGAARRAVGDAVALTANLDPVAAVRFGAPDAIRHALRRARDEAGGKFLAGAGCEIPSGTPPENLRALCEPLPPA